MSYLTFRILSSPTRTAACAIAVFLCGLPAEKAFAQDYSGSFTYANGSTLNQLTTDTTSATVTLGNLNVTYDGKSQAATATTNPPDLKVSITYNGKSTKPVNAGTYAVAANVTSSGYTGSATGTMVISPEPCTITFTKLTFTYDGSAQAAKATTSPSGAGATFTYDSSSTAPTLVGSYTVVATAKSSNYTGSATGTETITPVAPKVSNEGTTTIGAFSATLKATVNPEGSSTTVNFQYGTSNSYGLTTSTQTVPAGTKGVEVTAAISGLNTTTKYHFRVVAVNGGGTKDGADAAFTTTHAPILSGTTSASVGASGGEVLGSVNPNGIKTTAYYQYGTSSNALTSDTAMLSLGSSNSSVPVLGIFPNLQPNTTYYYQLVVTGSAGTFYGATGSFTTLSFDTVLVQASGDTAPVPNVSGATFAAFGIPIINDNGNYAFFSQLTISGSITASNDLAVFEDNSNGVLQYVARTGDVAPGTSSATYTSLSNPVYNNHNQCAFEGLLKIVSGQATSSTDQGIWSDSSGTLSLVARKGSPAPGCPANANFLSLFSLGLPYSNGSIIYGILSTGAGGVTASNDAGIWQGNTSADLHLVQRLGDVVDGKTISSINFLTPPAYVGGQTRNFTPAGDITFQAGFTDTSFGIVKNIGGTSSIVYTSGSVAPGTETAGATYANFDNPIINSNDHIAFAAGLNTGSNGVTTSNAFGIWAEDSSGNLQPVAQEGESAPGTPSTFYILTDPVYNANEAVAFHGQINDVANSITGANNVGVWTNVSGSLSLLAQTGTQAPGCESGADFNDFQEIALPDVGGANNHGGVIFLAVLTLNSTAGVTASNNLGIWAVDPTGTLDLIVRTGDMLNVNGTLKTVSGLTFLADSAFDPGQTREFSQVDGQIVYLASFTDGSSAICSITFP